MSKKLLLKRSYAEVVGYDNLNTATEVIEDNAVIVIENVKKEAMVENSVDVFPDGVPGESRINPNMCFFKYKPIDRSSDKAESPLPRKRSRKIKKVQCNVQSKSDSDVEQIYSIPEVVVVISSDDSVSSSDPNSLPEPTRPKKRTRRTEVDIPIPGDELDVR